MGDRSGIAWTDATWNPVLGCSIASAGCANCYAQEMAARLERMGSERYAGLTKLSKAGPVWTGELRMAPDRTLSQPQRWARPRRVFVNSMSDLFHHAMPDGWIMRVWREMFLAEHHAFQVLTKRPDVMLDFVRRWTDTAEDCGEPRMVSGPELVRAQHNSGRGRLFAAMLDAMGQPPSGAAFPFYDWQNGMRWWPDTVPHIWLGFTAERQAEFDQRWVHARELAAMGWKIFVSIEPAIGAVRLPADFLALGQCAWVIWGGESGKAARPAHPDWARGLRDQCAAAGVPFFFKQWGEWVPDPLGDRCIALDGREMPNLEPAGGNGHGAVRIRRAGVRAAGDELDGQKHQEMPKFMREMIR